MYFSDVLEGFYTWDEPRFYRLGWNGKSQWIKLQRPTSFSKMTKPYIYMEIEHEDGPPDRVPWLASQIDMLADDWVMMPETLPHYTMQMVKSALDIVKGTESIYFRREAWPKGYALFWYGSLKGRASASANLCLRDSWTLADEVADDWLCVRDCIEEGQFGWVLKEMDAGASPTEFRRRAWPMGAELLAKHGHLYVCTYQYALSSITPEDVWANDWYKVGE